MVNTVYLNLKLWVGNTSYSTAYEHTDIIGYVMKVCDIGGGNVSKKNWLYMKNATQSPIEFQLSLCPGLIQEK